jgi:hypothetical protein
LANATVSEAVSWRFESSPPDQEDAQVVQIGRHAGLRYQFLEVRILSCAPIDLESWQRQVMHELAKLRSTEKVAEVRILDSPPEGAAKWLATGPENQG